jgi:hypothetical protein
MQFIVIVQKLNTGKCKFEVFSDDAKECSLSINMFEWIIDNPQCSLTLNNGPQTEWYCLNFDEGRRNDVSACVKEIYPSVQNLEWKIREDGWVTYHFYGILPEFQEESEEVKKARTIIRNFEDFKNQILMKGSNQIYVRSN